MFGEALFLYFIGLAAVVGVLYALRLVVLWYFRLDRIVELLEKIAGDTPQANGPQG